MSYWVSQVNVDVDPQSAPCTLRERNFNADWCGQLSLAVAHAGRYLTGGGRGDMSPSIDFGVPLTGIDSVIPGWDAFNPPHWNEFCPSISDMNPQQRRPQAQRCKKLTRTANEVSVRVGNSYRARKSPNILIH